MLLELKYDVKTRQNCKYEKEVKRETLEYACDVSPQQSMRANTVAAKKNQKN